MNSQQIFAFVLAIIIMFIISYYTIPRMPQPQQLAQAQKYMSQLQYHLHMEHIKQVQLARHQTSPESPINTSTVYHESSDTTTTTTNDENQNQSQNVMLKSKFTQQLNRDEYNQMKMLFNEYLAKKNGPNLDLKDNTLNFLYYDEDQNKLIGMMCLLVLDQHDIMGHMSRYNSSGFDLNTVILYNLCVDDNYRKKGIGSYLIECADEWCAKNNKNKISLYVSNYNQSALNLYKKYQYQVNPLFMTYDQIMMTKILRN